MEATGDVDVPISFGFHPYLTLPGSDRRGWDIKLPVARQALIDERMLPTGETRRDRTRAMLDGPLGERIFDTSYPSAARRSAASSWSPTNAGAWRSRTSPAIPVSQVYAPEESQFICYEPMTAPVDALISGEA